jgi:hypothetical protein
MTIYPALLSEICGGPIDDGDGMHVLHAFSSCIEGGSPRWEVLPIHSRVRVLPDHQAIITARPQRMLFQPERLLIPGDRAAFFVIDNIEIGGRSQFAQDGGIPADMFAAGAIDLFVRFEAIPAGIDIRLTVTYIGPNPEGEPFVASIVGKSDGGAPPTLCTLIWLDDRDHVYRISKPLHLRTSLLERIDGEDLDNLLEKSLLGLKRGVTGLVTMIDPPRVVTLRVATVGRGIEQHSVLYGIDDSVDAVIFDVPIDHTDPPTFDLNGYRPRWLGGTGARRARGGNTAFMTKEEAKRKRRAKKKRARGFA